MAVDAGFLNPDDSVNYWGIIQGAAEATLAVLSIADPPLATAIEDAIKIGTDLVAAIKAGQATAAQLQTHATSTMLTVAPHITVVSNGQ